MKGIQLLKKEKWRILAIARLEFEYFAFKIKYKYIRKTLKKLIKDT